MKHLNHPRVYCANVVNLSGQCNSCELKSLISEENKPIFYSKSHLQLNFKGEPIMKKMILDTSPSPSHLQEALALLQRSFHSDVHNLISHCLQQKDLVIERPINLTGQLTGQLTETKHLEPLASDIKIIDPFSIPLRSCRTWVVIYNNTIIASLVWRCVCVTQNELINRMLEVLFLACHESYRHTNISSSLIDRLINYARFNYFSIITVAAVPYQGIAFWEKNGFKTDGTSNHKKILFSTII